MVPVTGYEILYQTKTQFLSHLTLSVRLTFEKYFAPYSIRKIKHQTKQQLKNSSGQNQFKNNSPI